MKEKVLITGGTGLVGQELTHLLLNEGYEVSYLTRNPDIKSDIPLYKWDIKEKYIDTKALEVDYIVHLAGAGVGDKRWSKQRKKEIMNSRRDSTWLLFEMLSQTPNTVKAVVSASAIGYYGVNKADEKYEDDKPGKDFLAQVVVNWEKEVDKIETLGIRTVKLRTGVVLSDKGGALEKMAIPVQYFIGAPLGSGKQMMPWIHIHDLARMFLFAIQNEKLQGAYNAVGPKAVTNKELTNVLAKVLHRPLLLPNIPSFVLEALLGEMATIALEGVEVSNEKIISEGFQYQFPDLKEALQNLYK